MDASGLDFGLKSFSNDFDFKSKNYDLPQLCLVGMNIIIADNRDNMVYNYQFSYCDYHFTLFQLDDTLRNQFCSPLTFGGCFFFGSKV